MEKSYVYILSNYNETVFYTGVTANLEKRMYEHINEITQGFTSKYKIKKLMYYEVHENIYNAITREKTIKRWKREWKLNLINCVNPLHNNLYENGEIMAIDTDNIPEQYL